MTVGFVVTALVLFGLTWLKSPALALSGVKQGILTPDWILVLVVASMVMGGLIHVIVPKELITRYLGASSGWRGVFIGSIFGALMPGPPYACFPLAGSLLRSGAGIGPIVAFVSAWSIGQIARIPFEIAMIGPRFVLVRLIVSFLFPPLAGLVAQLIVRS